MGKSVFERAYEAYLQRTDQIRKIAGQKFYRVIVKDSLVHPDLTFVSVLLPKEMFLTSEGKYRFPCRVIDERGNVFVLKGPEYLHFEGPASQWPEWNEKALTIPIMNLADEKAVGDYLAIIEE